MFELSQGVVVRRMGMAMTDQERYAKYCRPRTMELLGSVGLDKAYHRASGDYIYFYDNAGDEVRVTDFLGGYGASLFGHNNPRLKDALRALLEVDAPFAAQASVRTRSALLGERLSFLAGKATGRSYVTTLSSTGAECVEAAMKHAEYARRSALLSLIKEIKKDTVDIAERLRRDRIRVDCEAIRAARLPLTLEVEAAPRSFFADLERLNREALARAPLFIAITGAFHGKTTGALSLTHNREYREPFELLACTTRFVGDGDRAHLDECIAGSMISMYRPRVTAHDRVIIEEIRLSSVAALFVEPQQGEGGIRMVSRDFLRYCRTLADSHGIPLVFDEIQCGMGRTGTFFYSEQCGVCADYYLLSKSLGGGMAKIAALLVPSDMYQKKFGLIHTSTFAEDDYSAGIALAALDLLDDENRLMQNCRARGIQLVEGLRAISERYPGVIADVRGAGLMIGVELHSQDNSHSRCIQAFSRQDLLGYVVAGFMLNEERIRIAPTLNNKITVRLEPSAYIGDGDCRVFLDSFERLCEILYKHNAYELTKYIIGLEEPGSRHEIENFRQERKELDVPFYARNVAFTAFIIENSHFKLFDESMGRFTDEQIGALIEKTYLEVQAEVFEKVLVSSSTSDLVCLNSIPLMINSDIASRHLRTGDTGVLKEKIEKAVMTAVRHNCSAISFGGYTSIVTNNCTDLATDAIALSTGNSLTAGMGIEAMYAAAEEIGIDLGDRSNCLAAIGAGGNICSVYCEILAEQVENLLLIGRPGGDPRRLDDVASEILFNAYKDIRNWRAVSPLCGRTGAPPAPAGIARTITDTAAVMRLLADPSLAGRIGPWLLRELRQEMGESFPIRVSADVSEIFRANLIVSASNAPGAVIYPEMLGDRPTIICDIATPPDVHESCSQTGRSDLMVIQGGVVGLPCNPDFQLAGLALDRGQAYACLAEVLLMGFSGMRDHFSYGRISKHQVKKMMRLAGMHGMTLARYKNEKAI
jgi:acetylornithine/succinyldiaminopimelate/putrescine aminotransferase/predicted amino acid dehydrogenase